MPSRPPPHPTWDDSGVVKLKTSHPYHTQAVMQFAVTWYKWCDFDVFPMGTICRESTELCISLIYELQQGAQTVLPSLIVPKLCVTTNISITAMSTTEFADEAPHLDVQQVCTFNGE